MLLVNKMSGFDYTKNPGSKSPFRNRNSVPTIRLKDPMSTPKPMYMYLCDCELNNPNVEASVIKELDY